MNEIEKRFDDLMRPFGGRYNDSVDASFALLLENLHHDCFDCKPPEFIIDVKLD